jgi:hypothetical protein
MSSGCFTTEITLSQVLCVKIDDALTFEQGAGLPCVYATAAMALDDKANLKKDQVSLLIPRLQLSPLLISNLIEHPHSLRLRWCWPGSHSNRSDARRRGFLHSQ